MDLLKELTVSSFKKTQFGKGKREFLILKEEIRDAILAGFNVKEIWEYLYEQGRVSIKYDTFSEYVRRYGLRKIVEIPAIHKPESKRKPTKSEAVNVEAEPEKTQSSVFKHDSTPDQRNLIGG